MPNELKPMKAWLVREKDEFCATVVFAETRGKAKAMALSTDCCEDVDFCRIEVRRVPQIDKYYVDGKREMYWDTPNDRIALVKECGFYCEYEEDCENCYAKEYCDKYQNYLEGEVADIDR
jgi:hypothetical protein